MGFRGSRVQLRPLRGLAALHRLRRSPALATVLVLTAGPLDNGWQPVAWLVIPMLILFFLLVKPQFAKRHIRSSNPPTQEVRVAPTDSGIDIRVARVVGYQRSWNEVAQVIHALKGIVILSLVWQVSSDGWRAAKTRGASRHAPLLGNGASPSRL
jgi:hypothetical protein